MFKSLLHRNHKQIINFDLDKQEYLIYLTRLKYGWFTLKLYSMFQDVSRRSVETSFWRIWDEAQIH